VAAVHVLDGLGEAGRVRGSSPFHPELVGSIGKCCHFVDDDRSALRKRKAESAQAFKRAQKGQDINVTPADFYHQRAAECFALAHQISDQQERGIMTELANCWLRLLDRVNEGQQ
jgi:hypothetical protein